jgi:putative ubiquitin-RnfH superfamily antitoxin RatB of RatAB toxin-antitoxin module
VYARPSGIWERAVSLPAGATLADAIAASGVLQECGELQGASLDLGVYNRVRRGTDALRDGDRVEIYRPLIVEPKEARRVRAEIRRRRSKGG